MQLYCISSLLITYSSRFDHIMANQTILDKEYFTRKWCLMEYFLAKSRGEAIMPFLVDMKVDTPVFPIPLPKGVICNETIASSKATEAKVINDLILYFSKKDSSDYTDRY
mmetsp:Transcript_14291/g.16362  ORF Transcript_14291/g.16362 Transcript_14291/m.16362 type:complete len:110 (+) Transcript_14291:1017-1346(+)